MTFASPALAALKVGDRAPDFSVQSVLGGDEATIHLSDLLSSGPVVIFFLPHIHSGASASECRAFADSIDAFHATGATVIGMSRDSVDELAQFSTEQCSDAFPMASADLAVVTGFDVNDSANFTTRTTYIIAPSGEVAFVHDEEDHTGHARRALTFLQNMRNQ